VGDVSYAEKELLSDRKGGSYAPRKKILPSEEVEQECGIATTVPIGSAEATSAGDVCARAVDVGCGGMFPGGFQVRQVTG
jgi:hypothetical protein